MMSPAENAELKSLDFLVFSDDWGEHPSSCQHIFRHIAKNHRVLWVNTIGMRNPTLTLRDAQKVVQKVKKMTHLKNSSTAVDTPNVKIVVCQPLMLPGVRWPMVRAFNTRSVTRKVRSMLDVLNFIDPIVVTTVPNAAEYPEILSGRRVLYYCVDDFSLWPGLDSNVVRDMEAKLIARSDCIIGASEALCERFQKYGKRTHLLTHGVDIDHFSNGVEHEHKVLNAIPKPRVGFFGLIDGRMDWNLLVLLARTLSNVNFVFAGPVDSSAGLLPHESNIHFVGAINYAELPEFVCGIDALILPYKNDDLGKVLSPLKLKEYLATGRPILSSAVKAAEEWEDAIVIARTIYEWEHYLRIILNRGLIKKSRDVCEHLSKQSWQVKAREMLKLCRGLQ